MKVYLVNVKEQNSTNAAITNHVNFRSSKTVNPQNEMQKHYASLDLKEQFKNNEITAYQYKELLNKLKQ